MSKLADPAIAIVEEFPKEDTRILPGFKKSKTILAACNDMLPFGFGVRPYYIRGIGYVGIFLLMSPIELGIPIVKRVYYGNKTFTEEEPKNVEIYFSVVLLQQDLKITDITVRSNMLLTFLQRSYADLISKVLNISTSVSK